MHEWRRKLLTIAEPQFREAIIEYVDEKIQETNEKVRISEDNCKKRFDLVVKTMEENKQNYLDAISENTLITMSVRDSNNDNHDATMQAIKALSKKQDDHIKSLSVTVELENSAKKSFNFVQRTGENLKNFGEWFKGSLFGALMISVMFSIVWAILFAVFSNAGLKKTLLEAATKALGS